MATDVLIRLPAAASIASQTQALDAIRPLTPTIAALTAPTRSTVRYSVTGEWLGTLEHWAPPATVPAGAIPDIMRQAAQISEALRPADRGSLLARIHTLLAQYRQDPLPPAVEQAIAEDWADDLGEFPMWAIEQACRDWRRHPTKYRFKPLPGDILGLCREIVEKFKIFQRRIEKLQTIGQNPALSPQPLAQQAAADIRGRIHALAKARRMPGS